MKAEDVIDLYTLLQSRGVSIWLDGGWGVDALLGEQTRPHEDVDIVIQQKDLVIFHTFLSEQAYEQIPTSDARWWNYVMKGGIGKKIDVHVISLDENGDGIYGPKENDQVYPANSFKGKGRIEGAEVHCLSPEYQIESHAGYELKEKDFKDVFALCNKFNLPLPAAYSRFVIQE